MPITLTPDQQQQAITELHTLVSKTTSQFRGKRRKTANWSQQGRMNSSPMFGQSGVTSSVSQSEIKKYKSKISRLEYALAKRDVQLEYLISNGFSTNQSLV